MKDAAASGIAERGDAAAPRAVPSLFLGRWLNTNPGTAGMAEVTFREEGGSVVLGVLGVGDPAPIDWGPTRVSLLSDGADLAEPTKMQAAYDFGFMDVLLHAWVKQGVLVIAVFNRFRDGSGRSNYFDREFFYRAEAGGDG
ncbi:hypothetical protein OJF2_71520 [Aquisphaera giovannonii]|uniref:Uncharacterized protein n=1 Tax=Aquisphaera giovannonii TaxID=406548 RepID=A0A5B9WE94_9BACT|nr:hypothetical protein [Aquisphaera giovannonii]QEH38549.1 hypothetical protein OJF2_71520 [Aquisphaera giovannonii]